MNGGLTVLLANDDTGCMLQNTTNQLAQILFFLLLIFSSSISFINIVGTFRYNIMCGICVYVCHGMMIFTPSYRSKDMSDRSVLSMY
jgi:hypothetical protein